MSPPGSEDGDVGALRTEVKSHHPGLWENGGTRRHSWVQEALGLTQIEIAQIRLHIICLLIHVQL